MPSRDMPYSYDFCHVTNVSQSQYDADLEYELRRGLQKRLVELEISSSALDALNQQMIPAILGVYGNQAQPINKVPITE